MTQLDSSRYKRLTGPLSYGQSDGLYWDGTNSQLVMVMGDAVVARIDATGITADLEFASEAQGDILRRGASAWERHAAATSGQVLVGDGTDLTSVAVSGDATLAASGALALGSNLVKVATGEISAADIVATDAGKLGHANGYPLLAAVGSGYVPEFIACALFYDFDTAAYTAGGNTTVNLSGGGAAQSDPVSAANCLGAAADKLVLLRPPTASAGVAMVDNAGLNLVAAVAFTDPGTAVGVLRYALMYRVHATGL